MPAEYLAAGARGPGHTERGVGNEDAWQAARLGAGLVVAVADGMGSKPNAATGARTACRAAIAATDLWWRAPGASERALPDLIESLWRAWLGPVRPDDARSTCLVAAVENSGALVVAALGDGLALVSSGGDEAEVVTSERSGFANETDALGSTSSAGAWRTLVRPSFGKDDVILLTTDGVSDDLLPGRRAAFAREIVASFGGLPELERSPALWRALHDWPTPGHSDDKTVAVLWCPR